MIKFPNNLVQLGLLSTIVIVATTKPAQSFAFFGNDGLNGGRRWTASPYTHPTLGERSLEGGLRYSLEGGSYEAYRDQFNWTTVPSVADFTQAISDAFGAWTAIDPVSGLGTSLSFVPDLATDVVSGADFRQLDPAGAEIDLLARNAGDPGTRGVSIFRSITANADLTSGTANYANSSTIIGSDIHINNNPDAIYSLDLFRRLLTHELGHSLGLGDVENAGANGQFVDDNYDDSTDATALATLTNPFTDLIDPLNPGDSSLSLFTVDSGRPGFQTPQVDILMESNGVGIGPTNPIDNLTPLTNDDYAGRQFLYPSLDDAVNGVSSVILQNPSPSCTGGTTVCNGIGTNNVTWSEPVGDEPNSLLIEGTNFSSTLGSPFVAGNITYSNEMGVVGTAIDSLDLFLDLTIDVPGLGITGLMLNDTRTITITSTPNTGTPEENADFLTIEPPSGLASTVYGNNFHVLEGAEETAPLWARVINMGTPSDPDIVSGFGSILAGFGSTSDLGSMQLALEILGFDNSFGNNGFITNSNPIDEFTFLPDVVSDPSSEPESVPEPASVLSLLAFGVIGSGLMLRRKGKSYYKS